MPIDYEFGPFRLDARQAILFRGTEPIGIGQRATALLLLLVERAGEPVAKEDLITAAWPGLTVEDSNLTVQVAALRKALGEADGAAWIETLARRGYAAGVRVVRLRLPEGQRKARARERKRSNRRSMEKAACRRVFLQL